jgi:CNT family concentrative nucleoside transporter
VSEIAHALAGLAALVAAAWLASEDRARVPWRTVAGGFGLAFVIAALCLGVPAAAAALASLNAVVDALDRATTAGTAMVFGYLGGGPKPFPESDPAASFVLAFRALPVVLVTAALSALLFHLGILPAIVRAFARVLRGTLGLGGTVGVAAAANVFVGMVEAPLVVRPYLARVSRGELFAIMACGMASISGTVLFLYASLLRDALPGAAGHLFVASIVSAPAALVVSFLMVPPEGEPTGGRLELRSEAENSIDAITRGALDGAQLFISIVAMLIVFVAIVTLMNRVIEPYTLQGAVGWLLAPLAWLAGVPWSEAPAAGMLLGTKTVLNELVAYVDLAAMHDLSERSRMLMSYALCGFANFGSLGIMIGGLGTMCPERRGEVIALGLKSIVAGTLATCLTAATVGLIT